MPKELKLLDNGLGGFHYPYRTMDVGDWFALYCDLEQECRNARSYVSLRGRTLGRTFTVTSKTNYTREPQAARYKLVIKRVA